MSCKGSQPWDIIMSGVPAHGEITAMQPGQQGLMVQVFMAKSM